MKICRALEAFPISLDEELVKQLFFVFLVGKRRWQIAEGEYYEAAPVLSLACQQCQVEVFDRADSAGVFKITPACLFAPCRRSTRRRVRLGKSKRPLMIDV
jgi:hypothetical protein